MPAINTVESRVGLVVKNRKILSIVTVNSRKKYNCLCLLCNKNKLYYWANLQKQTSDHCGCQGFRTGVNNSAYKHGLAHSDEFKIWAGIKKRITNPRCKSFSNYVLENKRDMDPAWIESFEKFYTDMGPRPSKKHTVERVDNSRGYWPDNCIWANRTVQNRNKRNNIVCFYGNKKYCLAELCTFLNLNYSTVYMRLKRGHNDPFFGISDVEISEVISSRS